LWLETAFFDISPVVFGQLDVIIAAVVKLRGSCPGLKQHRNYKSLPGAFAGFVKPLHVILFQEIRRRFDASSVEPINQVGCILFAELPD
jgi:hypothetical protein